MFDLKIFEIKKKLKKYIFLAHYIILSLYCTVSYKFWVVFLNKKKRSSLPVYISCRETCIAFIQIQNRRRNEFFKEAQFLVGILPCVCVCNGFEQRQQSHAV